VAVRYLPAAHPAPLGGDWYDWFALPGGELVLGIGGVDGNDERAAAAAAQAPTLLRGSAFGLHPSTPGEVLAGLDRALRGTSPDVEATALLTHIRPSADGFEVRWSSAGHPPPVLLRPDGVAERLETGSDHLLGADPGAVRTDHTLLLTPGSTLVLSSEGLVERRHSSLETGIEWLVDTLRGLADQGVEDIADVVLGKSGQGEDDVVLVVIRG
jgi:serine phosphatase RsbU (regulator of sigma subunit)